MEIIKKAAKFTFMPMTVGGLIKNLKDVEIRLKIKDKISINSAALKSPNLIKTIAKEFGSQCLVVSIDVKFENNAFEVYSNGGTNKSNIKLKEWLKIVCDNGAGEILLNSIDRDGSKKGYDFKLLKEAKKFSKVPVIICGGVGEWKVIFTMLLKKVILMLWQPQNIFHYNDQSVYLAKKFLYEKK